MRTATSLVGLWRDQDRLPEARKLLASTYARFSVGFDTADLRAAKSLLAEVDLGLKPPMGDQSSPRQN